MGGWLGGSGETLSMVFVLGAFAAIITLALWDILFGRRRG